MARHLLSNTFRGKKRAGDIVRRRQRRASRLLFLFLRPSLRVKAGLSPVQRRYAAGDMVRGGETQASSPPDAGKSRQGRHPHLWSQRA